MKFWKKTLEKRRRIKKINTIELQKDIGQNFQQTSENGKH